MAVARARMASWWLGLELTNVTPATFYSPDHVTRPTEFMEWRNSSPFSSLEKQPDHIERGWELGSSLPSTCYIAASVTLTTIVTHSWWWQRQDSVPDLTHVETGALFWSTILVPQGKQNRFDKINKNIFIKMSWSCTRMENFPSPLILQGIFKAAEEVEAVWFCYFPGLVLQTCSHLPN